MADLSLSLLILLTLSYPTALLSGSAQAGHRGWALGKVALLALPALLFDLMRLFWSSPRRDGLSVQSKKETPEAAQRRARAFEEDVISLYKMIEPLLDQASQEAVVTFREYWLAMPIHEEDAEFNTDDRRLVLAVIERRLHHRH